VTEEPQVEAASIPLVGQRGVGVALADDDPPLRERRPDDFGDVDRSVGEVQEQLGPRRDRALGRQEQRADLLPRLSAPGLPRQTDRVARRA